MQKFSFSQKKDVLIPQSDVFRPPLDKDGKPLNGDALLRTMANIATTFEEKNKKPVPIPDQKFVAWLKQAKKLMDEGMTSAEIFSRTLAIN